METIYTKRFKLRKVEMSDANDIFSILTDVDTTKYLNLPCISTYRDVENIINDYLSENKKGNKYPFAICDKNNENKLIGIFLIKLDLFDEDCYEFTVYIKKTYWNQGIYTEILPFMTNYVFYSIGTNNFRGFVMQSNRASAKVLLKNNFTLEKVFRVEGLNEPIESYLITKKEYIYKLGDKKMINLLPLNNSKMEKELYNKLLSIDSNIYMISNGDNIAIKENPLLFCDLKDILTLPLDKLLKSLELFFNKLQLLEINTLTNQNKVVILFNVDTSQTQYQYLFNFIIMLLRERYTKIDKIFKIVTIDLTILSMPNYAKIRFNYDESFDANGIDRIKKLDALLKNIFDNASDDHMTIYTIQ